MSFTARLHPQLPASAHTSAHLIRHVGTCMQDQEPKAAGSLPCVVAFDTAVCTCRSAGEVSVDACVGAYIADVLHIVIAETLKRNAHDLKCACVRECVRGRGVCSGLPACTRIQFATIQTMASQQRLCNRLGQGLPNACVTISGASVFHGVLVTSWFLESFRGLTALSVLNWQPSHDCGIGCHVAWCSTTSATCV